MRYAQGPSSTACVGIPMSSFRGSPEKNGSSEPVTTKGAGDPKIQCIEGDTLMHRHISSCLSGNVLDEQTHDSAFRERRRS
jgi:hypothetical protein